MKRLKLLSTIFATLIVLLLSYCKKQDGEKLFDGESRIRGIVLYDNIANGKLDTAATVDFKIYRQLTPNSVYQTSVSNGRFDIKGLANDEFTIEATMTLTGNITYQATQKFDISKGGFLDKQEIVLKPTSVRSPTLALQVLDNNGGAVKGAQVGLYTDPAIIARNPYSTTGSVTSGVTNASGMIVFPGLQAISYYASIYLGAGADTLSNIGTINDAIGPLNPSIPTSKAIRIGVINPSLMVTVTDINNAYIANATVRLYSDKNLLVKYGNDGTGAGSLRTAASNSFGAARFEHLQPIRYYVSVRKIVGKDTLSNKLTETSPFSVLQPGNNAINVVVR